MLKIEIIKIGHIDEMILIGKLEVSNAVRLETEFKSLLERVPAAIGINMENLRYIDSSGISALLRCANSAKKAGIKFGCYNVAKDTESVFNLSQVSAHINLTNKHEFMISN